MTDYDVLGAKLADAVGAAHVVAETQALGAFAVDGMVPRYAVFPTDVAGVQAVLHVASAEGASVSPRGHGTKMALGGLPTRLDIVLCLERLNQVVEYDVPNLTVIAQAGVVVDALQTTLAANRQFLPMDPPFPAEATIGGVVAANSSGPKRLAYGAARDLVLGMKVVMANGDLVSSGGKTVKNVAGYDLDKLFIGSLGTLCVIVEVAFRLLPAPEKRATLVAAFASLEQATRTVSDILKSQYLPTALEILNGKALELTGLGQNTYALMVALEGVSEAVDRQVRELSEVCRSAGASTVEAMSGQAEADLWLAVRDLPRRVAEMAREVVGARAGVVLSAVQETCAAAISSAGKRGLPLALDVRGGNGAIYAWFLGREGDEPRQIDAVQEFRTATAARGGFVVLELAPPAVKRAVSVWGPPGSDFPAMKAIKSRLDPQGILNPGRYVGGM